MERLGFGNKPMLDITSHDVHKNNIFYLQLKNLKTKETIFSEEIGFYFKVGTQLSLKETHNFICGKMHKTTYMHDPITDVIYTKCIFDKILRTMKRRNLNLAEYL